MATRWVLRLSRGEKRLLGVGFSAAALGALLLYASRTSGVLYESKFILSGAGYHAHIGPVRLTPGAKVTFETWFGKYEATRSFLVTADVMSASGTRERLESTYQCDAGESEDSTFRFGDFVPKNEGPWQIEAVMPALALPRVSATLAVRDRAFDWTQGAINLLFFALFCIAGFFIGRGDGSASFRATAPGSRSTP